MTARYEDLISHLITALAQRALFHRDHPRVQAAVADFVRGLRQRATEDRRELFFIGVAEKKLVHDGRCLFGSSLVGRKLVRLAEHLHCGGFLFRTNLAESDVHGLLDLCAEVRGPLASLHEARERLKARTEAVQLSPVYEDPAWFGQFLYARTEAWQGAPGKAGGQSMVPVFQSLFDTVEAAHARAGDDGAIDVGGARTVTEGLLRAVQADGMHDLLRLVRYPNYDTYTVGHSVRVALLAVQVGLQLGLPTHYLVELGTAGLLHDVGKAKIPREILFKPSRLSDDERRTMSRHPALGAQILAAHADAGPLSIGAAFGHHIRHDRAGYPEIARWHAVGKATALVHVCDAFEALTAVRPYKPALTPRRAFEILFGDKGSFHPGALAALVRSMGLYPPGSRVLLSTGERATVIAAGVDFERPSVRVTHDAKGRALPPDEERDLDLGSAEARATSIARAIEDPVAAPSEAELASKDC
jgi:HD-GYP domain-containing protein (c-di-GMP phosphodiesterase class II)